MEKFLQAAGLQKRKPPSDAKSWANKIAADFSEARPIF